jgi:hypothetical protein
MKLCTCFVFVEIFRNGRRCHRSQNGVAQGLSSAIMTNNLREAELFLSVTGSDCGIANVTSEHPVLKSVVPLEEKKRYGWRT